MGANLVAANLSRASAVGADFNQADLGDAKAVGVNLSHANVSMADLRCVDLAGAILDDADLSDTKRKKRDSWERGCGGLTSAASCSLVRIFHEPTCPERRWSKQTSAERGLLAPL